VMYSEYFMPESLKDYTCEPSVACDSENRSTVLLIEYTKAVHLTGMSTIH
jgi:hypothetical protein